jgi:dTDP-4-amino-4,6-dideoxygalactose transaminase
LQAALGLSLLPLVAAERQGRARIAQIYRERLTPLPGVVVPRPPPGATESMQYFVVRVQQSARHTRDQVYARLKEFGIHARAYFTPLCSDYGHYRHLPSSDPAQLPVAHRVAQEVLCLPFYSELGEAAAQRICDVLEYILEGE